MDDRVTLTADSDVARLQLRDMPDCIDIVSRCFDCFEGDANAARNWFVSRIANNPWQQMLDGIGLGVRHRGVLIAFRAMFAQPWWIEGRTTVMAFGAHTCVEPAYRGYGLGGKLIAASREFASLTGSTSAGNITQGIYRKHGFATVGDAGNDFFRLRASYVGSLQSRLGSALGLALGGAIDTLSIGADRKLGGARGFRLEPVTSCTSEFDELWSRARAGYGSCLERTSRFLNWRLFEFPTHPLALVALRDGHDRLRAYGIWHQVRYSKHVSCAALRDLFVANDDEEARLSFMFLIIRHWRRLGITWVSLEVSTDRLTDLFKSLGYQRIPSIGNRYHVHSRHALSRATLDGWFRSGLDGDYFDTRPSSAEFGTRHEA